MTIDYQAPLCREPGCGHHTWTGWCPDHREQKISELSAASPRSLSLIEKRFLRETEKRETDETRAIGEHVKQALPELFENRPTVEEIESAAMNIYIDAEESEVVRVIMTYRAATGREPEDETTDRLTEASYDPSGLSPVGDEEAADALSRRDFFGQSTSDAALVTNYLLSKSHEARLARGDVDDGEGIIVDDDEESYMYSKALAWKENLHERVNSSLPRIHDTINTFQQEVDRLANHQQQTHQHMIEAAQQLGFNRLESYSRENTPADASRREKKYAWSEMETMEMRPIRPDETAIMPQEQYYPPNDPNPSVSNAPNESKFVDSNGVVYNANMEPIGSVAPMNQNPPQQNLPGYPQQQQPPQQQFGNIPPEMIRQRGNQASDPRQQWAGQPYEEQYDSSNSASLGRAAARGAGKVLGGTAKLGWTGLKYFLNGSPNQALRDAERHERRIAKQQRDANQALIDMNKRQVDRSKPHLW